MVIQVYVSSCSGNMEIKRKQEFVASILEGHKIQFELIDISDAARETDKRFMRENAKPSGSDRIPLPPQIFNNGTYCGNYESFHEANENDELQQFLNISGSGHGSSQRDDFQKGDEDSEAHDIQHDQREVEAN